MKRYRIGDRVIIGKKYNQNGEPLVAYAEIVGVGHSVEDGKFFRVKDSLSRVSEISEREIKNLMAK